MALTPGPQEIEFNDWYETKFKPAMERGPLDKYVARQAWFAATAPLLERIAALTAQVEHMTATACDSKTHETEIQEMLSANCSQQVEQAAQPVHVGVFHEDDDIGHVELCPHQQMKLQDGDMLYTAPPKAVPLTETQIRKEHEPGPVNLWDGTPAKYGIAPADKPVAERWICLECLSAIKDVHTASCREAKRLKGNT